MAGESIDKVVLELEARDGQFRSEIQGAATVTDKALSRIENSATRMERQVGRSFGAAAQQSRLLGYQISDIGVQLSAGTSPFLVLAQQGPQVANALEGARGAVGRFATFLSGPYGAAILAATTLLGVWLSKTEEAANTVDDLVEKMKAQERQAELTKQAQAIFGDTIEGVTQALEENRKAIEQLNQVQDTSAEKALKVAETQRAKAIRIRETTIALIEQAKAEQELLISSTARGSGVEGAGAQAAGINAAQARLDALNRQLKAAQDQLKVAETQITQSRTALIVEQESASAEEKINRKYDAQIDRAAAAANASKKAQDALRAEIRTINEARDAELKRYQDSQRASRSTGGASSSQAATVGNMVSLIKQLFPTATITSTTGGKHTKGSDHYAGRAIDFVIPGMMNAAGTEMVRQMLQAAGVEIRRNAKGTEQFFGPGRGAASPNDHSNHFHVAWNGQASPESAQRARDAEERRRQSFENELASAMAEELAARRALITSAEEIDKINLDAIEIERQRYNDNLDSLVSQRKLKKEEADALRAINDETAKYKEELIKRNAEIRAFRLAEAQRERDAQLGSAARQDQAELLRGQGDLARTLDERNAIERKLLDLKYAEEKAQNDFVIAAAARLQIEYRAGRASEEAAKAAEDAARIAQLRNDSLDARKGNDLTALSRNNPYDRYLSDISDPKTRAQEAVVRQLQEVSQGISDGLAKDLGVKSQFVRTLFQIFLDDAVFKPIAEALRNANSGSGGFLGTIFSAVGAIFGGGSGLSSGSSSGLGSAGASLGALFGRAGGGDVNAGSLYRINEASSPGNPEYFQPAMSGKIIPLGAVNQRLTTATDASKLVTVRLDLSGDIDARIQQQSAGVAIEVVRSSAPAIVDAGANEALRRAGRPKI